MDPYTLATIAAKDEELRHFDAEQAFLDASVDEEINIQIPEKNQKFLGTVGLLNKIYGLLQAKRCWFNKFRDDKTAIGFEQSEADPCVFHKFDDGEVEMMLVVHMDDMLAHTKDQAKKRDLSLSLEK